MLKRILFLCVCLTAWSPLGGLRPAIAQETRAEARQAPKDEVLDRFVGTWEIKSTQKPAKWNPKGGEFTSQESTVWALKNRVILIRDVSQPDGRKGLYVAFHDAEQDAYPFFCYDSGGLMGTQWLLKWNPEAKAAVGRSTDAPPAWTSGGRNHFPDGNTNLVSFWMRDENGALLLENSARKTRLPADREAAILAAWKKHEPASDLPAELKVLDRMIGTWDTVTIQKPALWTPSGGRSTASISREWILNGRFLMDTSTHADGQESIALLTYDPGPKTYRGWWFNSQGDHNTSRGQWNESARTLSYVTDLDDGKTMRSSVRFDAADKEFWQFRALDAAGQVYLDMEITATRRATR